MSISSDFPTFVAARDQLLHMGVLINISKEARKAGISIPAAIAAGVNQLALSGVNPDHHEPLLLMPDIETAYYDIARMMSLNVLRADCSGVCTPEGKNGALVLTVLLPGED